MLYGTAASRTLARGRLFFAVMCTGYILVAIQLEERDLVTFHREADAAAGEEGAAGTMRGFGFGWKSGA